MCGSVAGRRLGAVWFVRQMSLPFLSSCHCHFVGRMSPSPTLQSCFGLDPEQQKLAATMFEYAVWHLGEVDPISSAKLHHVDKDKVNKDKSHKTRCT